MRAILAPPRRRGRLDRLPRRRRVPAPPPPAPGCRRSSPRLGAGPASVPSRSTGRSTAPRAGSRPGQGPVIERFARRAERGCLPNHHFKSILRTAAGAGVGGRTRTSSPRPAVPRRPRRRPRTQPTSRPSRPEPGRGLAPLRINHYVVKSREEFLTRKLPRGRATAAACATPASSRPTTATRWPTPTRRWPGDAPRARPDRRRLAGRAEAPPAGREAASARRQPASAKPSPDRRMVRCGLAPARRERRIGKPLSSRPARPGAGPR